jgi:site-specific DNA-methyltransferase (adenine-specific)
MAKEKKTYNRTLRIEEDEVLSLKSKLKQLNSNVSIEEIVNSIINQSLEEVLCYLPEQSIDLLFIDPPYNLTKNYGAKKFDEMSNIDYEKWFETWFIKLLPLLKSDSSIYVCCDWRNSSAVYSVLHRYLKVQNRITWEREKGRGALHNWKNNSEDIWFCTKSNKYFFDVDSVKLKRKVIAPYKVDNEPKDWKETEDGKFRITFPSNLWTDISIPFWSMPENTDHPTQKPEKLLAKIILASSREGDIIFDPFLGSGTTAVVAKKLNRNYIGIEQEEIYCLYAQKRLIIAETDKSIQGYFNGVFWERNSLQDQEREKAKFQETFRLDLRE